MQLYYVGPVLYAVPQLPDADHLVEASSLGDRQGKKCTSPPASIAISPFAIEPFRVLLIHRSILRL